MPVELLGPSRIVIPRDSGEPQGSQVSNELVGVERDRDRVVGIAQGGGCSVPLSVYWYGLQEAQVPLGKAILQ